MNSDRLNARRAKLPRGTNHRPNLFDVERLEQRTLFAAPSDVLTKAIRQELLNHWNGSNKTTLQAKLDANQLGAFDGALLSYMTSRGGQSFFWNTSDVAGIKSFVNANLSTSTTISNANNVVAHKFPNGNSSVYDQDLGAGDINWKTTTSNSEFVHTQNRMGFWQDLAQAYVFNGNSSFVNEMISELSSWSAQSPALSDPNSWATSDPPWQPLDVAFRADNWVWSYQMVLGSSGWTGDANTLFLYKLYQHGDFLNRVTPYALSSNRALFEATGLMEISQLIPEFDNSATWETYGRNLLFNSMDAQINADGGHDESSPGYAGNVIESLLEMYWLDQKRGDASAWDGARVSRLTNAAKSFVQLLSPDGNQAALSDTYRTGASTFWDRPRLILNNTTDFPAAKPRTRDVWLFGTTTSNSIIGAPVNPALPNRGSTYSMPDSGYYMMRSGSDINARQVTFDAGPTGGQHGHFDLLNFELFGYDKPLISDPGLYTYDSSTRRNWAISTPAHNTISVDNLSHAALEGVDNPGITSSTITNVAGGYQITASHRGYAGLTGSPVVSRSIWYDGDGTMIIVDWGESATSHTYATSFLLPTTNSSRDLAAGWIHTNFGTGDVYIQSLLQPGQTAHRQSQISGTTTNIFTSNDPDANIANDATRYYVDQSGTFAGFVTIISTYTGPTTPNITGSIVGSITPGGIFQVQLQRNGSNAELVSFAEPAMQRPGTDFRPAAPIAGANDIAYDASGRLFMVYNDTNEKNLKYSVRETNGQWSIVQTIDAGLYAGGYPSLALDSHGNPAVAYFDGNGGDLKFAKLVGGAWQVETVDSAGSVGLYPSLVFSRNDGAMISYYKRTTGDLRLAIQVTGGWQISNVDTTGDVGRITQITLDPNRPTASKVAISYDDATTGFKKFAIQSGAGWSIQTVDTTTPTGGGYTSLVYEPFKDADGTYHPAMSYYDSSNSALKYARLSTGTTWINTTVISTGVQGLYTSLFYDVGNRPNIFFFKKTNNTYYRAVKKSGAWAFTYLGTGGREAQIAKKSDGSLAYTNLDVDGLRVGFLAS
jgi:hypothetical protein